MRKKKRRVYGRKLNPCSKLRLFLTETEAEQLDDSTLLSGASSRGFLIAEALRAGLANPNQKLSNEKRGVRVDAWLPAGLVARVKELAATHHLPQQHLLRLFLLQYLAAAPWEQPQAESMKEALRE
jgi:hypothetical protein